MHGRTTRASFLLKWPLIGLLKGLALMIDFKSLAYATLRVLGFVVDILFKKLFVVVEHYFIVQKVF